jgi:acetyl-CoA synthetase
MREQEIARGNDALALWITEEDGREQRLTYAELKRRSDQVASFLRGLGVARGDRILLMLGNEVPLWETFLAAIKLGAVVIPSTPQLTRADLADRLERGNVKHIVANATGVGKLEGLGASCNRVAVGTQAAGWIDYATSAQASDAFVAQGATRADDPMLLYFTSGTTSRPKLVLHTHQSYPVGHLSTMYWLGIKPGDVHWTISSPGWAKHAWSCFFAPLNAQACIHIYNYTRFDALAVLDVIERHRVTSLCAPPTVWRMLIQEKLGDHRNELRELISAGEPLNPEVIEQVKAAWGIEIRDGFGQTETTCQVGNSPGQPLKVGSMGRPLPGYKVALLDPDGKPADEGELCLDLAARPVGLMTSYADDPEKTAEVMRDGYYHTGDVVQRDADGYITYVGRADDVFKSSGYRISPFELESVLIEHPAVAEAAVVPSFDAVKTAVPKAFVILAAGHAPDAATARAIFAFCREKLAGYKLIRRVEFSDLPKTISGKIRRVELRTAEMKRAAGADGTLARREREFFEEDVR